MDAISAPAPNPSTMPSHFGGQVRSSASTAPTSSGDAATTPHSTA
ncbi:hypothetical protein [Microbacterium alcoholitolerans]